MYHEWQSYDIWFMRYGARQRKIFFILPFYPTNNLENQNFEKMRKRLRYITILHMCTIYDNHIMYGSWNIEHDREIFLTIWTILCPFTSPLTTQKIQILKKNEKCLEILSFYTCVSWMATDCMVPQIWKAQQTECFVTLSQFLPFYPTKNLENQILKKWKIHLMIASFYKKCTKNRDKMLYCSWDMA